MTTQELIKQYSRMLTNAINWQTQADALRDKIAKRILKDESFYYNGVRATKYSVKACRVKAHNRRAHAALRITI